MKFSGGGVTAVFPVVGGTGCVVLIMFVELFV